MYLTPDTELIDNQPCSHTGERISALSLYLRPSGCSGKGDEKCFISVKTPS